mgnify:CR=1 FL=1
MRINKQSVCYLLIAITVGILIGAALGIDLSNKGIVINTLDSQIQKAQFEHAMKVFLANQKSINSEYDWALDTIVRYLLKEQLFEEYQFDKYRQKSK